MSEKEIDQVLVERVQKGDKAAFELLVSKYHRKIIRLISRLVRDPAEVEDVAQDAFIKAYRALPQFRGESAFYTWLVPDCGEHGKELPCDPRPARSNFYRSRC